MTDTRNITALRETLQYVVGSAMPAHHKTILMDALTQALRAAELVEHRDETQQKASEDWAPDEVETVETFLRDKVAGSWQQADEALMRLSGKLHRQPDDVRRKATELGVGVGVDFRLAKASKAAAERADRTQGGGA